MPIDGEAAEEELKEGDRGGTCWKRRLGGKRGPEEPSPWSVYACSLMAKELCRRRTRRENRSWRGKHQEMTAR